MKLIIWQKEVCWFIIQTFFPKLFGLRTWTHADDESSVSAEVSPPLSVTDIGKDSNGIGVRESAMDRPGLDTCVVVKLSFSGLLGAKFDCFRSIFSGFRYLYPRRHRDSLTSEINFFFRFGTIYFSSFGKNYLIRAPSFVFSSYRYFWRRHEKFWLNQKTKNRLKKYLGKSWKVLMIFLSH